MAMTFCPVCERVTHHLLNSCTGHSNWPSLIKRQLAIDTHFIRSSDGERDLPSYVPPMVKQTPTNRPLLRKIIDKRPVKLPSNQTLCVGCKAPVTPGMCYTGSIIAGLMDITREVTSTSPILGIIEIRHPQHTYIIGGDEVTSTQTIKVMKRNRGFICDVCAADYRTVDRVRRDGSVESHPVVKTDPLPGTIGTTALGSDMGDNQPRRFRPAFNTRVTQGQKGRRV